MVKNLCWFTKESYVDNYGSAWLTSTASCDERGGREGRGAVGYGVTGIERRAPFPSTDEDESLVVFWPEIRLVLGTRTASAF